MHGLGGTLEGYFIQRNASLPYLLSLEAKLAFANIFVLEAKVTF